MYIIGGIKCRHGLIHVPRFQSNLCRAAEMFFYYRVYLDVVEELNGSFDNCGDCFRTVDLLSEVDGLCVFAVVSAARGLPCHSIDISLREISLVEILVSS